MRNVYHLLKTTVRKRTEKYQYLSMIYREIKTFYNKSYIFIFKEGKTLVQVAIDHGHDKMAQKLVSKGATIDSMNIFRSRVKPYS